MNEHCAWGGRATQSLPRLEGDLEVDVAIVGGGITGLTAAYLIGSPGQSVAVFERDTVGAGDTGNTSAHLTSVTDRRLSELARVFGEEGARLAWAAGDAAIEFMHVLHHQHAIKCDFKWVSAYLTTGRRDDRTAAEIDELKKDAELAQRLGFESAYLDEVPLFGAPGVQFFRQARIHPRRYLIGLAQAVVQKGGHVFEHSEVSEFHDDPRVLVVNGHRVHCRIVIIATHVPLQGFTTTAAAAAFQSKLASYSSYVVGLPLGARDVPDALFFDTQDPYHYVRVAETDAGPCILYGGEDHKTGQAVDGAARFARLESEAKRLIADSATQFRWSGQVVETPDGLPYIGQTAQNQFSATGYAGNGLTFGTFAGMMAADYVAGRASPWQDLFSPARKATGIAAWTYLSENVDFPLYYAKQFLRGTSETGFDSIAPGEGKIVRTEAGRTAAYRDKAGTVHALSPTCTHLGCDVRWNDSACTWDCPCHGSRFAATGEVLAGPAERPLEKVSQKK